MLTEAAFRALELEGTFQPDRYDYVLSAIAWSLEMLLTCHGFRFEELDSELLEGGLKFRVRPEKTMQQIIDEKNELTSRFFSALKMITEKMNNDNH